MSELFLTSPIPPSVNSYLNYRVARSGRRLFVQSYPTNETKTYKKNFLQYVKDQVVLQNWKMPDSTKIVRVECTFFIDRKRKDPNNLFKVMLDVLTEAGVYPDDDKVLPIGKKIYIDKNNPRIELKIYIGPELGVFESSTQFDSFVEKNCKNCSKNHNKCVILRNLLDYRIVEDVENFEICNKIKYKKDNKHKNSMGL